MWGKKTAAGVIGVLILCLLAFGFYNSRNNSYSSSELVPAAEKEDSMVIWVASDIHFLTPQLTDGGPLFTRTIENGDGKMVGDSEEIVDAFLGEALEQKPDALVLSGDLTFNGEKESLEALADKLDRLLEAGIGVLVIPGNHDIEYPFACRYTGEHAEWVDQISEADFKEICGRFGYDAAVSRDEGSFSYLYELTEDVGILALDANTRKAPGKITEETLTWMEEQLQWAQEKGMEVISVSHQNLLPQNNLLSVGFVMRNHGEVFQMLEKYGVKTHFSGHSHIWHSRTRDGLTDVATGSLAVSPLGYHVVEINDSHEVSRRRETLHVLQDESREFFEKLTERQVRFVLSELSLEEEIEQKMVEFVVAVNREYFGGTLTDGEQLKESEGWGLWKEYGREIFWYEYLDSILNERFGSE